MHHDFLIFTPIMHHDFLIFIPIHHHHLIAITHITTTHTLPTRKQRQRGTTLHAHGAGGATACGDHEHGQCGQVFE